jgi:uncharacterized NAD-dependent epimerase/dehydratase family protein
MNTLTNGQKTPNTGQYSFALGEIGRFIQPDSQVRLKKTATAVVYCEGNFGSVDGKTANGIVRYSEKYEILSVIDSKKAGLDSGIVLDNKPNGIRIRRNLADALKHAAVMPDAFIFGMAPSDGMLSAREKTLLLEAISLGMNVVSGLHEFLCEDDVFVAASKEHNVELIDVRKPRAKKDLRMFSGRIAEVTCPRIAVLGTDCAIGKRTTATILTGALNEQGLKAVMIGTGQTGIIQGARYGVALDAIPSQFCSGEIEATVIEAFEAERPDVIIIEGQGALSHPAFSSSIFILRGAMPDGFILQHAPGRAKRCDFSNMDMPTPTDEINLLQSFSDAKFIGLTLNHENMTEAEIEAAITSYEREFGMPVTDALTHSPKRLVDMIFSAFPALAKKMPTAA